MQRRRGEQASIDYRKPPSHKPRPVASPTRPIGGLVPRRKALDAATAGADHDDQRADRCAFGAPVMQEAFFTSTRRWLLLTGAATLLPAFAGARSRQPPAAGEEVAAPLLAVVYTGQVDPALCLDSEKYDGVRAVWNGRVLRHRSGRPVSAPASFVKTLPREAVDGELWLGRGRFDELSAIVRKAEPREIEWARVRYMGFEMPGASGRFAERAALQRKLNETVAGGGEGLMLHLASAPMLSGRSEVLMKLKPRLDAEAVVVGHRRGTGKYGRQVGAFEVVAPDGRRFLVGSGLTDALRRDPRPVGSSITYRYRDLTPTGLPRLPRSKSPTFRSRTACRPRPRPPANEPPSRFAPCSGPSKRGKFSGGRAVLRSRWPPDSVRPRNRCG